MKSLFVLGTVTLGLLSGGSALASAGPILSVSSLTLQFGKGTPYKNNSITCSYHYAIATSKGGGATAPATWTSITGTDPINITVDPESFSAINVKQDCSSSTINPVNGKTKVTQITPSTLTLGDNLFACGLRDLVVNDGSAVVTMKFRIAKSPEIGYLNNSDKNKCISS